MQWAVESGCRLRVIRASKTHPIMAMHWHNVSHYWKQSRSQTNIHPNSMPLLTMPDSNCPCMHTANVYCWLCPHAAQIKCYCRPLLINPLTATDAQGHLFWPSTFLVLLMKLEQSYRCFYWDQEQVLETNPLVLMDNPHKKGHYPPPPSPNVPVDS